MKSRLSRGGIFSLLWLMLTAALILFLYSKFINVYFKNSPRGGLGAEVLSGQGIDTSSYKAVINSTKKKVEDINNKHLEALDEIYEKEE